MSVITLSVVSTLAFTNVDEDDSSSVDVALEFSDVTSVVTGVCSVEVKFFVASLADISVGSSSGTDGLETADGATVVNGSWSVETDRSISVEFADDPVNEESSGMVEVPDESVFISDC